MGPVFRSLLLGLFLVFVSAPTHTVWADDSLTLREITELTDQKQWDAALKVAERGSTLARAYYEWLNLAREDTVQSFERYEQFLKNHGDWPGTRRIRANAERVMPIDLSHARILSFYHDAEPVTARGMVALIRAMVQGGISDAQVRTTLNDWFMDANLGLEEQSQILSAFKNGLEDHTLRYRLDHMVEEGNERQARDLARFMGRGYVDLVSARLALADMTRDAEAKLARVPVSLRNDSGLVLDRMKWRRRKTDDASGMMELFRSLPAGFKPYDSRAFWNEQQNLVYRLMRDKDFAGAYGVAVRPFHDDKFARGQAEWMAGHIALAYLKQPGRAFRHFEALYKIGISPLTRARAAYWAGEASDKLGYPDVARAWYRAAAVFRGNFYGQMAATKIPEAQRVNRRGPPAATNEDQNIFDRAELPRVARVLMRAGDTVRAEQFVNRMADLYAGKGGLMRLTVDLANELKLTSAAVRISRAAAIDGIDFADYVYPTLVGVGTGDVEPALVYAVIRQESGFDVDAVSSAGARGLMQLMPATAKAVARAERERHTHDWLTSRPEHNIRLGSAYLSQLIRQYNNYALVAAAYNAGPGRVRGWLDDYGDPRAGEISLVDWIERIPLYETRNYVQRVLEGTAVYRQKLKSDSPRLDPLHLGTGPTR